jgi:site-specific DNA-adenine methylase
MTTHTPVRPSAHRLSPPATAPRHIDATPRPIAKVAALPDATLASMRYQSPLRYPGAKSGLASAISHLMKMASASIGRPHLFVEPFAGGASTALRLAGAGVVDRVLLADADPLVARFWQVAAADTNWLIDRMWSEPVTLERWDYWRSWTPTRADDRDVAMKCLFLNRTTFSGILHGRAGPIGGRQQTSQYAIDCRFNKQALEQRLQLIGHLYATNRLVDVWCKDWHSTLTDVAEWYPQLLPNRVVAYLDPPYLQKSERLYAHSFDPAGGYAPALADLDQRGWTEGAAHYRLAEYLRRRALYRWVLSYDHHPALTADPGLYAANQMTPTEQERADLGVRSWRISKRLVKLHYSVASTGRGKRAELLITTLPPKSVPTSDRFRLLAGRPA